MIQTKLLQEPVLAQCGGVNAYSQSDDQVKIRFSCVKLIMAVLRDILESVYMWLSWLTQSKVRPFSTVQNANGMVNGMVQVSPSTVTYRFTSSVHCGAVLIRTPRVDSSRICKHVNIAAKILKRHCNMSQVQSHT